MGKTIAPYTEKKQSIFPTGITLINAPKNNVNPSPDKVLRIFGR